MARQPRRVRDALLLGAASVALAACGGGGGAADPGGRSAGDPGGRSAGDPGMLHVHGLVVDADGGSVVAATHTGVFRIPLGDGSDPPAVERVGDSWPDLMALASTGGRLLASGHPDPRETGPPHLGLVSSEDGGRSWRPLSFAGEADFHALDAAGTLVVGWDSATSTLRRSDDGGGTWQDVLAVQSVSDVALLPGDSVLAVAGGDLLEVDRDRTLQPEPLPPEPLSHVAVVRTTPGGPAAGRDLVATSVDGRVLVLRDGAWSSPGAVGAAVTALTVVDGDQLVAATHEAVLRSVDGGRSWEVLSPVQRPAKAPGGSP